MGKMNILASEKTATQTGNVYAHAADAAEKYFSRRPRLWKHDMMKSQLLRSLKAEYGADPSYPAELYSDVSDELLKWAAEGWTGIEGSEIRRIVSELGAFHCKWLLAQESEASVMVKEADNALNKIDPQDKVKRDHIASLYLIIIENVMETRCA